MSRLALGTAQFGMDHGINNTRGKIPASEAGLILNIAHAARIDLLDTAYALGESESVLGQCLKTHSAISDAFRLVSKLPDLDEENDKPLDFFLSKTLARLGIKSIYGYLLGNFGNIRTNPDIIPFLKTAKKEGRIGKLGYSLYYPGDAETIVAEKLPCDIVLAPYNLFDRRFEPLFPLLRERGVEIYTRSVFLQGLLMRAPETLPAHFAPVTEKLESLRRIAAETGLSLCEICLGFALSNRNIDRVLCGVDSMSNIKENITAEARAAQTEPLMRQLNSLRVDDENIIIPSRWSSL
ncbi:MAG: aldo/keto reductase [Elusimicrobiaceae bacterium]|nr:aldo/keto reductase [Elusimicrobiaceae bacterium]